MPLPDVYTMFHTIFFVACVVEILLFNAGDGVLG